MAYRGVGVLYGALGEVGRSSEYYTRAFQLREHASEREKLEIVSAYYSNVTGEVDKSAQADEDEIENYPQDGSGYLNLNAQYAAQGQYERAAAVARQSLRLAPDRYRVYNAVSTIALALQHFDESRQVIRDAQARKLDDFTLHGDLYNLAFLEMDSAAMAEQQQWFAGHPDYEDSGLARASDTEAYAGRVGNGR